MHVLVPPTLLLQFIRTEILNPFPTACPQFLTSSTDGVRKVGKPYPTKYSFPTYYLSSSEASFETITLLYRKSQVELLGIAA